MAALASLIAVVVIATVLVVSSMSGSGSHASKSSAQRSSGSGTTASSADKPNGTVVPILTYNVINAQPPGSTAPAGLYVPADEFSAQMDALKAAGWHAVTLNQVAANWAHGTSWGRANQSSSRSMEASPRSTRMRCRCSTGWAGSGSRTSR